ncbi:hypothetical protein [Acidovorax sp. SUPP3334]|uniref:hypothetical protein n=1 Tax=Acidovorax sp. SUPP3334 TaxID=2920881 RepID=UPI0023DE363E|nr:hypothetical protein [Acidovorax sp. SUPP3334]GKT23382.1 hypothetical protein AVHM3334_11430 [Acidovorax sp. SUPP3334]
MSAFPVRIALLGTPGESLDGFARNVLRHLDPAHATLDTCPALIAAVLDCLDAHDAPSRAETARQALASLANAHAATGALTLLVGLEGTGSLALPPKPSLPAPPRHALSERFDACLRQALSDAGVAYRVLYGSEDERLRSTLIAIKSIASSALNTAAGPVFDSNALRSVRLRAWACEKCSDPECEHKLFTALRG